MKPNPTAINTSSSRRVPVALITLMAVYAMAALLPLFSGIAPQLIVAANIIPPAIFAFVHGSQVYRLRGILAFTAICFVVGNILENIGIRTGFPFGSYSFTDVMGPKLLGVPLLMGPAYLAIGYTSWILSQIILSPAEEIDLRPRILATPLLATCIMVAWDFSAEPMWSTVGHFWIWRHGGPYFGIPISNFLGWFLANYIIFQVFALYLAKRAVAEGVARVYWRLGVISFLVVIAASLARSALVWSFGVIPDATGIPWRAGSIALASAMVSLLLMGTFAFLAGRKVLGKSTGNDRHAPAILAEKAALE
ncbi:MAG TPA: carotenoid biosynthesis protein [Candidatus Angelobacter sp.]|nr:carotenoid biosynthesis protein [Candidatus Angelobacter sp.]